MNNQSLTITGLVVILLGFLLQRSGMEVAPEEIQTTIEVLAQLAGIIIAWYGRVRHGDISILGKKR